MKTNKAISLAAFVLLAATPATSHAATPYGWSGNAGWIDFAPAADTRVSADHTFLHGRAHAPNFGWIDLGDGTPASGTAYTNTSAGDFGVNHDGAGALSGYAYAANIGWINFNWAAPNDPDRPRTDLVTGAASGYAYSGNVGWINLADLTMPGVKAQLASGSGAASAFAGSPFDLELKVFGNETLAFSWMRNGAAIPGVPGSVYNLASAQLFHAGNYGVRITRADGSTVEVDPFTLGVTSPAASGARLVNISTRARSLGGSNIVIPGFVATGSGAKQLLIRAVGPGLADFGVVGALADPRMTLNRDLGGTSVPQASNDNWGAAANAQTIVDRATVTGAFALAAGSADAALAYDAEPGVYTLTADGVGGAPGVTLVEVYDADAGSAGARLSNLSIRAFAGTGEDAIIPGFVISDDGPLTLLIRAVGPRLADFGVTGVLADPKITVFSSAGMLFENDNWEDLDSGTTAAAAAAQAGAFTLNPGGTDAAMAVTLAPGAYTVQVADAGGSTGTALFELYEIN